MLLCISQSSSAPAPALATTSSTALPTSSGTTFAAPSPSASDINHQSQDRQRDHPERSVGPGNTRTVEISRYFPPAADNDATSIANHLSARHFSPEPVRTVQLSAINNGPPPTRSVTLVRAPSRHVSPMRSRSQSPVDPTQYVLFFLFPSYVCLVIFVLLGVGLISPG